MNIITISNFDQLKLITSDPLCFSGNQSEEIYHKVLQVANAEKALSS